MKATTLTVLKQSIKKWERNAVAEKPDDYTLGTMNCPLCNIFWEDDCMGCPVRDATGKAHCHDTPYDAADIAVEAWEGAPLNTDLRDAAHAAAIVEAEFLRSLLPEEAKQ